MPNHSSVGVRAFVQFLAGELLAVDGVPGIDDVGEDEGHEEGDVEHGAEGELAAAGVLHRQR